MDHNQCRKKIDHLEDELDYNFGRKEELKEEVKKLKEDNDLLRKTNFKNAQAQIMKESEPKAEIGILEKENDDLKLRLKELEYSKSEIAKLKETISTLKEENIETVKDLRNINNKLKSRIEGILKCDKCDKCFDDKSPLISHIQTIHSVKKFKCDGCDKSFQTNAELDAHTKAKYQNKTYKEELLTKHDGLVSRIDAQKVNLYNDLYKLKQKETKNKAICRCIARLCKIKHSIYRWTASESDKIFNKLSTAVSKDVTAKYFIECHQCDKTFADQTNLQRHVDIVHGKEFCENTSNENGEIETHLETLHALKMNCQECDQTFENEKMLNCHIDAYHGKNKFELTFFNPSVVN